MVPPHDAWQNHIVGIVKRLTQEYGADDIFLDTFGWQTTYPMYVGYPVAKSSAGQPITREACSNSRPGRHSIRHSTGLH
jgi:hypothetical protein